MEIFVLGLCLLMGLLLCCSTLCSRKPRLLATEEVTLLWGQWALRSVRRNQRLTSRKDFALAGRIRKLNKKRREDSLRQRYVHSHLVAIEIGIVSRADEWVNANGRAFNQDGLEGLNG